MTSAEYLSLPDRQDFYQGDVMPITSESAAHDRLVKHVASLLEADSGLRRCTVFSTTTKIEVIPDTCYLYADIAVTCNFLEFKNANGLMRQPRILAEVSTAQSRERDRGLKWTMYQQISSLQYYLLIDQEAHTVELFSRDETDRQWHSSVYAADAAVIELSRFEMAIPLKAFF